MTDVGGPGSTQWNRTSVIGIIASFALGTALAFAGSSGSADVGPLPIFALGGILAFGINLVAFVPALALKTERFFDATGSITYITVTIVALLLSDDIDARSVMVTAMVVVWAVRLGTFLFARIRRDQSDGRFDAIKTDPMRFLMTWSLQGLWVFLTVACALAVIVSEEREAFGVFAVVGLVVWIVGFAIEVVADEQKSRFRRVPANQGRFITSGLWAWSRHPNYFGEITLWVGVAVVAIPVLSGSAWLTLVSPVFVVVLLTKISGIPLVERRARKRWGDDAAFQEYTRNTPVLVLRPPRR